MGYPSMPFSPSDIASVMAAYSMASSATTSNTLASGSTSSSPAAVTSVSKGQCQITSASSNHRRTPSGGGVLSPTGSSGVRRQMNNGDEISSRRSSCGTPADAEMMSAGSRQTPLSRTSHSPAPLLSQVQTPWVGRLCRIWNNWKE